MWLLSNHFLPHASTTFAKGHVQGMQFHGHHKSLSTYQAAFLSALVFTSDYHCSWSQTRCLAAFPCWLQGAPEDVPQTLPLDTLLGKGSSRLQRRVLDSDEEWHREWRERAAGRCFLQRESLPAIGTHSTCPDWIFHGQS